jgi:fido (protein-threonine AMPylation protein)
LGHIANFDRLNAERADWIRIKSRAVPTVRDLPSYRYQTARGLEEARFYLVNEVGRINPMMQDLREAHRLAFAGATTDAGQMRKPGQSAAFNGQVGVEAQRIQPELARLKEEMYEMTWAAKTPEDQAAAIAFYHARFMAIQPFQDGNAPIGRAIVETQAAALGLHLSVKDLTADRQAYEAALSTAFESDDIGSLTRLVAQASGIEPSHKGELIAASHVRGRTMVSADDIHPLDKERELAKTGFPPPIPSQRSPAPVTGFGFDR